MKNIPYIFSDGSLFQANSDITITGETERNSILHAKILFAGKPIVESESYTDERGCFSVTLKTPSPSFNEYDIILSCLSDAYIMRNVLFGELWLAAGQSNMQFMNSETPKHEKMLYDIIDKKMSLNMQGMVGFRNIAVHDYKEIDEKIIKDVIENHLEDLLDFARIFI